MNPTETTHRCPFHGEGFMSCCGKTPFEVPRTDRMTVHDELVTCGLPVAARLSPLYRNLRELAVWVHYDLVKHGGGFWECTDGVCAHTVQTLTEHAPEISLRPRS